MKKLLRKHFRVLRNGKEESGFTLFEYCIGAAVMLGALYSGFSLLGGNLSTLMTSINTWVGGIKTTGTTTSGS